VKNRITEYQNEQNTKCEGYEAVNGNITESTRQRKIRTSNSQAQSIKSYCKRWSNV